jgi:hypothetical protein
LPAGTGVHAESHGPGADRRGDAVVLERGPQRDEHERAGIVVLEPEESVLDSLWTSLENHGVTATIRAGAVRLSVHAGTSRQTLDQLRGALLSFATAASY